MYNKLLLDFDWVVYRAGFSDLTLEEKIASIDGTITRITDDCGVSDYDMYLTGSTNFRYNLEPNYKIDRKNNERPEHYLELREHLISRGAIVSEKYEADDLCGINSTDGTIIVGEDKDLLMIPGRHYRIKKRWEDNEFLDVSEDQANLMFMVQLLTGDKVDSIPGVKNPYKSHHKNPPNFSYDVAYDFLKDKTPEERITFVESAYEFQYGDKWHEKFDLNGRLLWILRDEDKTYEDYI